MYTYYMLAAMGPKVQKYLWWKKYLTVLQMVSASDRKPSLNNSKRITPMLRSSFVATQVQFILVMGHAFQLLIWNECNYPIAFAYFIGAHAVMFYFLFSNFYKQAYTVRKQVSGR